MRGWITLAMAFALMAGCASETKLVTPEYGISIWNNSAHHIKEIRKFDCQGTDVDGKVLASVIKRGSNAYVKLTSPVECVNLFAFDYEGNIVARQRQVSIPPDFRWVIQ